MAQISYIVRSFVVERLLDSTNGFNFWIGQTAPEYNVQPFVLTEGSNLFQGALTADLLEEAEIANYPLVTVSTSRGNQQNLVTPNEFAGTITTTMDWWTSFPTPGVVATSELVADAIEDACFETFNNLEYQTLVPLSDGVTYNGELSFVRSALDNAGENWRQLIRYTMTHRVMTSGRFL